MKNASIPAALALCLPLAALARAQPSAPRGAAAAASAEPSAFSEDDRRAALRYLEGTRAFLRSNLEGLSEAQWRFKPGVDRWSIAEIAEHIALAEERVFGLLGEVLKSKVRDFDCRPRMADEVVIMAITNRSARRFQAPERLQPSGRFASRAEVLQELERVRDRTLRFVQDTRVDLRAHAGELPVLGTIDGQQWLLFVGAHAERHTLQIEEVKADPRFPRS